MDILVDFVDNVTFLWSSLIGGISTLLSLNYALASALLSIFQQIFLVMCDALHGIVSAIEDLQFFLWDVVWFMSLLFDGGVSVVCGIHGFFAALLSATGGSLAYLAAFLTAVANSALSLFGKLIGYLRYAAGVFAGALLVLLQCLPYSLVALGRFAVDCVSGLLTSGRLFVRDATDAFAKAVASLRSTFWGIPSDAYVGLVMAVSLYFLCTKTPLGFYLSPKTFCRVCKRVLWRVARATRQLAFQRIPWGTTLLARFLKESLACCLGRVRCWIDIGATYWQEEEEELEEEEARDDIIIGGCGNSSTRQGIPSSAESGLFRDGVIEEKLRELEMHKERNLCIICQDQPKSVILLPCRHLCLCEECCSELLERRNSCPLCRTPILTPIRVFT